MYKLFIRAATENDDPQLELSINLSEAEIKDIRQDIFVRMTGMVPVHADPDDPNLVGQELLDLQAQVKEVRDEHDYLAVAIEKLNELQQTAELSTGNGDLSELREKIEALEKWANIHAKSEARGIEISSDPDQLYCNYCGKKIGKPKSGRRGLFCSRAHSNAYHQAKQKGHKIGTVNTKAQPLHDPLQSMLERQKTKELEKQGKSRVTIVAGQGVTAGAV